MARIINSPADAETYLVNRLIYRRVDFDAAPDHPQAPVPGVGGTIVEAQWGDEYEADGVTLVHAADTVSFAQNAEGGWDKAAVLRLGNPAGASTTEEP
jgi:hypothetical protein